MVVCLAQKTLYRSCHWVQDWRLREGIRAGNSGPRGGNQGSDSRSAHLKALSGMSANCGKLMGTLPFQEDSGGGWSRQPQLPLINSGRKVGPTANTSMQGSTERLEKEEELTSSSICQHQGIVRELPQCSSCPDYSLL